MSFCVLVDGGGGQHIAPWTESGRWPAVASAEERMGENIVSYKQEEDLVQPKPTLRRQESEFSAASPEGQHQKGNAFTGQRSSGL
jgi:hypothetical protein